MAYTATAGQTDFVVPFPHINRTHVKVAVNGSLVDVLAWPNASTVRISNAAGANDFVEVYRDTPIDEQLVSFNDGNILTAEDLNIAVQQTLYRQQELNAKYERVIEQSIVRIAEAGGLVVPAADVLNEVAGELASTVTLNTFQQRVTDIDNNALGVLTNAAEILNEQTARADGDNVVAQSVTTLSTTVAANSATVTTLQSSVNGIEAKYGVTLNVNGHITGFSQNNDGTTGDFIITADKFAIVDPAGGTPRVPFQIDGGVVKIGGDLIVNGTIQSDQLAANSVTQGNSAFTLGSVAIPSATWTAVQSCGLTATGGSIRVDFCGMFDLLNTTSAVVQYRILRDATVIRTGNLVNSTGNTLVNIMDSENPGTQIGTANISFPVAGTYSFFVVDDGASAGAVTYTVEVLCPVAGATMASRQMSVLELKK